MLKGGEYIEVSTLGGGDTTGLDTHLSNVEIALPPKSEQSTLETTHNELLVRLGAKASSQALAVAQHSLQLNSDQIADASTVAALQSTRQANGCEGRSRACTQHPSSSGYVGGGD